MTLTVRADRGDIGRRLDLVLRRHLGDDQRATRTRIQAWIAAGEVQVNGAAVRRAAARVQFGDAIAIGLPESRSRRPPGAEPLEFPIVFEDAYMLAVDKPAGMVAHPAYRNPNGTLLNGLLWRARTWPSTDRPSLVGRIDKLTSGVVLVAKTAAMHARLQRAVTEKEYLAVVYGRVTAARGSIDLPLARIAGLKPCATSARPNGAQPFTGVAQPFGAASTWRTVVAPANRGARSVTHFERLARAAAPRVGLSLVRCSLGTGRTHQIRVHLAARGWPIVGDRLYGEPRWSEIADTELADALRAFPRQALHAWRLSFTHPATGTPVKIEAPIPRDFAELLRLTGLRGTLLKSCNQEINLKSEI